MDLLSIPSVSASPKAVLFPFPAPPAFPARGAPVRDGPYHEFFAGMQYLLGGKWDEKNPHVGEFSSSCSDPGGNGGNPAKQLQTIDAGKRERMQSAIRQKEMTKWQTHP
jgi:hypothetical protein